MFSFSGAKTMTGRHFLILVGLFLAWMAYENATNRPKSVDLSKFTASELDELVRQSADDSRRDYYAGRR
jgi:hypothetical protein